MKFNLKQYRISKVLTMDDAAESYNDQMYSILSEFFNSPKGSNRNVSWEVIPFPRLKKIWEDYVKMGFVRDEKGLDAIVNKIINNIARLEATTVLAGHDSYDPDDIIDENGFPSLKEVDREGEFYDYFLETPYGTPVSDYGLKPLWNLATQAMESPTAEEKIVLVDRILNTIHQRGDLAAFFIEGGSKSLSTLSS